MPNPLLAILSPDSTHHRILSAIQHRNLTQLHEIFMAGWPVAHEDLLATALVEWGDPQIFDWAGQHLDQTRPQGQWVHLMSAALEAGREDLADRLLTAPSVQPCAHNYLLTNTLLVAIERGQIRTVDALKGRGMDDLAAFGCPPVEALYVAASHGQSAMLDHLLRDLKDPAVADAALFRVAEAGLTAAALRLWEAASPMGRPMGLLSVARQAAVSGRTHTVAVANPGIFDTFVALWAKWKKPDQKTAGLPSGNRKTMELAYGNTLEDALYAGHDDRALAMVPHVEPKTLRRLLPLALDHHRQTVVRSMIPLVDLNETRHMLAKGRPPRWDLLDELAVLVPDEVRSAWLTDKKNEGRLPRAQAMVRAEKTQTLEAPTQVTRRRLRS